MNKELLQNLINMLQKDLDKISEDSQQDKQKESLADVISILENKDKKDKERKFDEFQAQLKKEFSNLPIVQFEVFGILYQIVVDANFGLGLRKKDSNFVSYHSSMMDLLKDLKERVVK